MKILLISQYASELKNGYLPNNPILLIHFKNYHQKIYHTLLTLGHTIYLSDGLDNEELLQLVMKCDLVFPIRVDFCYTNGDIQIRLLSQKYHKKIIGGTSYSRFYESDKIIGKLLSERLKIQTPQYVLPYQIEDLEFEGPYLVKPRFTGSSMNLSDKNILVDKKHLTNYLNTLSAPQDYYIEKYIEGITATIGCVIDQNNEIIMGVPYTLTSLTHRVITYEDKRNGGCIRGYIKEQAIKEKLIEYCKKLFKALQPCQIARFDFMLSKKNELYFLEINETPNLSATGGFVQTFLESTFSTFENFINHLLSTAISLNK